MAFEELSFKESPFWVHVVGLPPNTMTTQNAKTIGNFLGKFVELDPSYGSLYAFNKLRIRVIIPLDRPFVMGFHRKKEDDSF